MKKTSLIITHPSHPDTEAAIALLRGETAQVEPIGVMPDGRGYLVDVMLTKPLPPETRRALGAVQYG